MGASPLGRRVATLALVGLLAPARAAGQHGIDIASYVFDVTIPDTGAVIEGRAGIFPRRTAGGSDTLRLDLVGMVVDSVHGFQPGGGPPRALPFHYDGARIAVPLPPGVLWLSVQYRGAPSDGLILRRTARGRRAAFADNWPERARFWLPTVDHPSDKAEVTFIVRAPRKWAVVANGAPQGCRPAAASDGQLCSWRSRRPIPTYTMVIGATEMTVSRHRPAIHDRDTVPVEVWAYPEDSAYADSVPFRRATAIVEVMQRLVGPYPYANLKHVQSSTRYGGMENATAVFYDERGYVERRMGEGVVRHETAHQWFGDAVTPAAWEHLWLSEGFATYFDGVIADALDGDSALAGAMRRNAARYLASDVLGRPVIDTAAAREPMRLLNANSYQKGAWVLHMLRGLVGDSAFFRGVRAYYATYRDSSVTTAEFRRLMERFAGAPLDWFFRQWLERPGHPRLAVEWRAGQAGVAVRLVQRQPAAWGLFRLPLVTLEVRGPGGESVRRTLALTQQELSVTLDVPFPATELRVDPDGLLLLQSEVTAANPGG